MSAKEPLSPPVKIQCSVPPVQGRLLAPRTPFQLVWFVAATAAAFGDDAVAPSADVAAKPKMRTPMTMAMVAVSRFMEAIPSLTEKCLRHPSRIPQAHRYVLTYGKRVSVKCPDTQRSNAFPHS